MFGSILGRKKEEISSEDKAHEILVNKIDKMNLTDMRAYVKNSITGFEPCEDGLSIVLRKLMDKDEKTSKRYIESGDMDSKIKKAFDLILVIATHSKITVTIVEQIQEFIELYKDIIVKFDTENKQIYASKLKDALVKSIDNVAQKAKLDHKMKVLGE